MVKKLPAVQETLVCTLGWEDPLEGGMSARSSILAWRIPVDRAWWAAVCGDAESDMAEQLTHTPAHTHPHTHTHTHKLSGT